MSTPQPPCDVCGNRTYNLIEGFFYCTQCHTQNQTLRETESDQIGAALGARVRVASQKKGGDSGGQPKKKQSKFIENGFDMGKIRHWTMSSTDDYPHYLFQIGRRLTTFPRLVVQFATVLHRDFDVPIEVKRISLYLVQKYFQYYGIAFSDEEVEEEDEANQSIFRFNRSIVEVRKDRRLRENQRAEVRNVHSQVVAQSQQADIWNFLSQTQQEVEHTQATQNLELQRAFDDEDVNAIIECTTKLSKKATKLAARIYLEVDLVVAFAFVASQCAGANWISIWDIYRWFREGRLLVSAAQIRALGTAPDNERAFTVKGKRERQTLNGTLPMTDYLQSVIYLSHILPLPPSMPITPFEQIAKRFIFNLNLPLVFLHRIYALVDLIGTPLNDIGTEFYASVYPKDRNFVDKIYSVKRVGWRTYFNNVFKYNNGLQCFISLELKVTSLILLALKMMFGLDGQREYTMRSNNEDEEVVQFDVHDWLIQLNLRLAVWKGTPVSRVLSTQYLYQKSDSTKFERRLKTVDMGSIAKNKLNYDRCVPTRQYNSNKDKQFYDIFADDFSKLPTEHSSNEAFYTPLRFQATLNKGFRNEIEDSDVRETLDGKKEKLFFADYRDCGMDYLPNDELQYEYRIHSCNHNNFDDPEAEEKWLKLFPCAKSYAKYPITQQMFIMRTDPANFGFTPIMDYMKFSYIFEDSQRYFHSTFSHLIDQFSYILGEEPEGIYATFLLIENALFYTKNIATLKDALTHGKLIRSGFKYSKTKTNDFLNKYAYWIKESKRAEHSRHFVYGRNKIPSDIQEVKRLENWRNLERFTGEEGFPTQTVDEMMTQNTSGNNAGYSTSEVEESEDENNRIFDIERSDGSDEEEVEKEADNNDKDTDEEEESEKDDDNEEDVEMDEEVEAEEADDDDDMAAKTQRAENQQQDVEDNEQESSDLDSDDSDTTLNDDDAGKKEKKFGISSDLALTFLFWKYW